MPETKDEDEEATDALQSQPWVNQNLRKNPLCNDVGELHRDDLAEDLFTLPEDMGRETTLAGNPRLHL